MSVATFGTVGTHDIYSDLLEWVPDLLWPESATTYSRMRTDPQISACLKGITLPIRRASWALDPAGCRDEVVQRVSDDTGLPISGSGDATNPVRRKGIRWKDHVRLACGNLTFGFMPFAKGFDASDGATVHLAELSERLPITISDIVTGKNGELLGIRQVQGGAGAMIPRSALVWYSNDREGAAWQGQSMLRPSFAPWLVKHELWRVLATSSRRFGMGVPSVEAPAGATPQQITEANRLASSIRVGDQSGIGLPPGFIARLTGLTGSVPDTLAFIQYLDQQMSRSMLEQWLDLGQTPNGSRALGDTFVDAFLLSLQAIADDMAEVATMDISLDLVTQQWGEDEPAPRIICGDVGASHQVTAEAIQTLVAAGALTPDDTLEAFLRDEWKLPDKPVKDAPPPAPAFAQVGLPALVEAGIVTREWAAAQVGAPPEAVPPAPASPAPAAAVPEPARPAAADPAGGAPQTPVAAAAPRAVATAAATGPFRRQPTKLELAASTDYEKVQTSWTTHVDSTVKAWTDDVAPGLIDSLVEQVSAAVDADDLAALTTMTLDTDEAAAVLEEGMADAADEASLEQTAEAARQGVTAKAKPDHDYLHAAAVTAAGFAGAGLAISAGKKAAQAWGGTAEDVAAAVRTHLESLTGAATKDLIGAAMSTAQNAGRMAVVKAAPAATYVASELLDGATCDPCQAIDGTVFGSLDDAEAAYASGGYAECEGGLRCRGILVTVWGEGAAAT